VKVFLGGEGADDLGDWSHPPQYRAHPPAPGAIEALARKVGVVPIDVIGAVIWKNIKKFRFKPPVRGEIQNVLGLVIEAEEVGAEVLAFVRDQDGYPDRQDDIEEGIRRARARSDSPQIVGGVAVQEIEAWILALLFEPRSERHADAKAVLEARHGIADRNGKVAVIDAADLDRLPEDAVSLRSWVSQARVVLVLKS
jgi:hypothetical protein